MKAITLHAAVLLNKSYNHFNEENKYDKEKKNKFVFCILLEDARTFEMMRQKLHMKNGTLAFMLAITIKASEMIYSCEETDIEVNKTVSST